MYDVVFEFFMFVKFGCVVFVVLIIVCIYMQLVVGQFLFFVICFNCDCLFCGVVVLVCFDDFVIILDVGIDFIFFCGFFNVFMNGGVVCDCFLCFLGFEIEFQCVYVVIVMDIGILEQVLCFVYGFVYFEDLIGFFGIFFE